MIRVARNRGPDVRTEDIAADFGISELCLTNWLTAADGEDGVKAGPTAAENAELRAAKRRIRLLEALRKAGMEIRPRRGGSTPKDRTAQAFVSGG